MRWVSSLVVNLHYHTITERHETMRYIYSIKTAGTIDVDADLYKDITGNELEDASEAEVIDFFHQHYGEPSKVWVSPYVVSEDVEPWEL